MVSSKSELEEDFRAAAAKDPQPVIHLVPDRTAKYDRFAEVLSAAQRNHIGRIGFVNTGGQ